MAIVTYGALQLLPAPELGISIESKFWGAEIRYSKSQVYALKGTLLSNTTSGISGIYTKQDQIVTGFQNDYLPFIIDGKIIGYPIVKSISFDNGNLVQKDVYNIELEFLESGDPFQITGLNYGFTGVSGLFYNVLSLSESLDYTTDFRGYSYIHNIDIQYRTGFNIDPLLNAKIIASGLINNKSAFPFITSGGSFGRKTYQERENTLDGIYGVTENFDGSTGNLPYQHLYSIKLELSENGIVTVSQEGTIKGFDPDKYTNAKSGYGVIKNDIYPNCSGFYAARFSGSNINPVYLTDSRSDNIYTAIIQYNRVFTDESGVSNVRWQYNHQSTLDGNYVQANEQGSIIGLGHISERFNQASGFFLTIQPGIKGRILQRMTGFGVTGDMSQISLEKAFNRFNGTVAYNFGYSNNAGIGVGSGIHIYSLNIVDELPVANKVSFGVPNVAIIQQSLGSTSQGQRTVNVQTQAFRETSQQTILDFTRDKFNGNIPSNGASDVFINGINLNFNPIDNHLDGSITYLYGGFKSFQDIKI